MQNNIRLKTDLSTDAGKSAIQRLIRFFISFLFLMGALSLILFIPVALTGCSEKTKADEMIADSRFQLNTLITINLYDFDDASALSDAFSEISRLESILSRKASGSDLDKLAENAGSDYIQVSEDTARLFAVANEYSRLSDGLFDVTIGPLVSLWDIGDGKGRVPSADELSAAMALINYEDVITADDGRVMLARAGQKDPQPWHLSRSKKADIIGH